MLSFLRPGTALRPLSAALLGLALAGCASFGGGGGGGLAPGLTARMDVAGASLDRAQALSLVNGYRASVGAPPLAADAALDTQAQALAGQYAASGNLPPRPANAVDVRFSAGYQTFAETFSGWRNSSADAAILASRNATRAGLAVVHNPTSNYGVYWVLVLDDGA